MRALRRRRGPGAALPTAGRAGGAAISGGGRAPTIFAAASREEPPLPRRTDSACRRSPAPRAPIGPHSATPSAYWASRPSVSAALRSLGSG